MKNTLLLFMILFLSLSLTARSDTKWKAGIETQKVFIENKSQFDGKNQVDGSRILFGTDESPVMIYFTNKGLTYRFDKTVRDKKAKHPNEEEGNESYYEREEVERSITTTTDLVNMEWVNSNPDVEVIPMEAVNSYFNYEKVHHAHAYRKLLYKNLYPNIDAEYIFHAKEGIKYSLILHPGADVSQVRMKYSSDHKVSVDESGNIHVSTLFGDIIDHAPLTTYESTDGTAIPSSFILKGNIVSFNLGNYKAAGKVIIDPWTVTPTLPHTNTVFYIKADDMGNAFLYGGESPIRLQKYDSSGAMVWNYSTPWTVTNGSFAFGSLSTDRRGNSYISNGGGVSLTKIDSSGAFVWSRNTDEAPSFANEYWASDLNCSETELYIGGARHPVLSFTFQGAIFKMDLTNGSVESLSPVSRSPFMVPPNFNEVRSMSVAPNGNIYYLTLDTVGSVTSSFTGNAGLSSSYHFPYSMPYNNNSGGQGQNNIRATPQFLYTTDGQILHKRDLSNFSIIAFVTIPSGSLNGNSGIAFDSCGNIYVGSQNRVVKYDANLALVTSAATPEPVYDVSICANGDILACGHNYAVALDMGSCGKYKPDCCTASATISADKTTICSGDSAEVCAQPGMASYIWNNGATTQCIDAKLAGNYYVTVSDGGSCTATSNRIALNVLPSPPVSISVNGDTLTAYNSVSYQWFLNGVAITDATSNIYIATESGDYTVAVADSNGCSATSNKVNITTTGIEGLVREQLRVYPNPLENGHWNLECGSHFLGSKVEVFDYNGRLVYQTEISSQKSELALDVARGIYMMRVYSDRKNITLKLIRL